MTSLKIFQKDDIIWTHNTIATNVVNPGVLFSGRAGPFRSEIFSGRAVLVWNFLRPGRAVLVWNFLRPGRAVFGLKFSQAGPSGPARPGLGIYNPAEHDPGPRAD